MPFAARRASWLQPHSRQVVTSENTHCMGISTLPARQRTLRPRMQHSAFKSNIVQISGPSPMPRPRMRAALMTGKRKECVPHAGMRTHSPLGRLMAAALAARGCEWGCRVRARAHSSSAATLDRFSVSVIACKHSHILSDTEDQYTLYAHGPDSHTGHTL